MAGVHKHWSQIELRLKLQCQLVSKYGFRDGTGKVKTVHCLLLNNDIVSHFPFPYHTAFSNEWDFAVQYICNVTEIEIYQNIFNQNIFN